MFKQSRLVQTKSADELSSSGVSDGVLISRRAILGGLAGGSLVLASGVRAQSRSITMLAHPVIRSVAVGTLAGDITERWRERTGLGVDWVTLDTTPLHERLFREASLSQTTIDIATLLNARAVPRTSTLFEPLDELMRAQPIEDLTDIFPGLLKAMTFAGRLYAIPFRHSTSGMHYNEELFAERGISKPPGSIEEFIDVAKRMTYKRPDGTDVHGFVISGQVYPNVVDLARAWDGDFISPDFKVVANQPPMVRAVSTLREFYSAGILPRNFAQLRDEDINSWMTTGRAAMTFQGFSRNQFYNDPSKSKFPGKFKAAVVPVAAELQTKYTSAPVKTEFWSFAIPKNSVNKENAWSLIRELVSKENTVRAAINGNGPTRASAYKDQSIRERVSYAEVEALQLQNARVPLPAFDEAARAADIFVEEMQLAVLGQKDPQVAMDSVVARVQPLLP
jgi:multiple sugar transport system substrate-binding protein